jgi:hypothetical protein
VVQVQDITEKVDILLETPRLGRMVPEIGEDALREIGMYSYRIIYDFVDETLYIHGVIHKRLVFFCYLFSLSGSGHTPDQRTVGIASAIMSRGKMRWYSRTASRQGTAGRYAAQASDQENGQLT